MANCCVNGLNQVFCNAFNKYYNTLYTNGEISQEETNNLLIIDYIRQCLSDDRYNSYYNILLKALRCIANNSCLLDTSWLYNRSIVPKVTNLFVTVLTKLTFKETDPIFSASPAATITEEDIDNWNNPSGGGELSDWNEADTSSLAYIKNKPTIPAAQVQSNWNESDTSSKAFIQNKPTIPTVPTNVSAFNNDAGYLTQHQDIKTVNNTSLVGNGNIDLVPTETFNNFCPIIEDTRSSAVATITGVAPFSELVDGQRIILDLAYNTVNSTTLQLTLSSGTTTTAIPIKHVYNDNFWQVNAGKSYTENCFLELIYNDGANSWVVMGNDLNTSYPSSTQAQINSGTNNNANVVSPKLLHDNAYIVEESYSSGSLKANKMYDFGTVPTALTIPSLDATNDLVSNVLNFYALRFIAGADNISITFPTGVEVDDTPTINTGDYVEIMINLYVVNSTNKFYASIKVWPAQ